MLKNSLRRLVTFSIDHPKTVIGIVLVVTLIFLFQLSKIKIDTDPENMLKETQPERVFYAEVKKEFGINEFIVLGITDEIGIFRPQALGAIERLVSDIVKIEGVIVEDVVSLTTTDNIKVREGTLEIRPALHTIPVTAEEMDLSASDATAVHLRFLQRQQRRSLREPGATLQLHRQDMGRGWREPLRRQAVGAVRAACARRQRVSPGPV